MAIPVHRRRQRDSVGGSHRTQRENQGEDAALVRLARHAHVAAVQQREPFGQGEAQPRALVLASGSMVDLVELVEDLLLLRGVDPDPGVSDRDLDHVLEARRGDGHRALLGRELDRVGDEVQQHLLELAGVGEHLARPVQPAAHADLFLACERLHCRHHLLDGLGDRDRLEPQLHLACLHLREIEDVVDQGQEVLAAGQDLAEEPRPRRLVELALAGVGQELREGYDRVERRAQLVAHVGQKHALVLVGFQERDVALFELHDQVPAVERGHEGAHQLLHAVHLVAAKAGSEGARDDDQRPGPRQPAHGH